MTLQGLRMYFGAYRQSFSQRNLYVPRSITMQSGRFGQIFQIYIMLPPVLCDGRDNVLVWTNLNLSGF